MSTTFSNGNSVEIVSEFRLRSLAAFSARMEIHSIFLPYGMSWRLTSLCVFFIIADAVDMNPVGSKPILLSVNDRSRICSMN